MIKKQYFLKSCLFLLLGAVFYVSGEEKKPKFPYVQITNPTPENLKTYSGTCDDLQPITSFDDFIVQIFSHLDDDCLYLMPANELSQKLGIDVLDGKKRYTVTTRKEKPFTGIHGGIFLQKNNSYEVELASISLQEQRELNKKRAKGNFKNMPSSTTAGFRVYFTKSYLEKFGYPFYKNIEKIPKPAAVDHDDVIGGGSTICVRSGIGDGKGILDIPCLKYDRDNVAKYLRPVEDNLLWIGYTNAYIWVTNCTDEDRLVFFSIRIGKRVYGK